MRWAGLAGLFGFAGCLASPSQAASERRSIYPEFILPGDRLANDPCSVQQTPDVVLRDAPFESLRALEQNLEFLKKANPVFLCGLREIDVLGDREYLESADPKYTPRSIGLYTPLDRVIRLKASAGIVLTHEVGHHVHNLGYFAPTVREFLAESWTIDPATGERVHRCEGSDCFVNAVAASGVEEDWARTFEGVLMRPVETGVAVNFSLKQAGETPLQKKVDLIRSIARLPEVVKGRVGFGQVRALTETEVLSFEKGRDPRALPNSLPAGMVRRIHRLGKASIKSWVWRRRRYPFLAGREVVFPVYRRDIKRFGFFAYDLDKAAFVALELEVDGIPADFSARADGFTDLEVVPDSQGGLLLLGKSDGQPALAAPVTFQLP